MAGPATAEFASPGLTPESQFSVVPSDSVCWLRVREPNHLKTLMGAAAVAIWFIWFVTSFKNALEHSGQ